MRRATSNDPLVAFLYILMRDKLPSGAVENILERHVEPFEKKGWSFTNGYLAEHAKDIARRLRQAK